MTYQCYLRVNQGPDGTYTVTVVADEAFLKDPETVYPVVIDPTYSVRLGSSGIEDVPIYSGRPRYNHGANTYNHVGYVDSTYGVGRLLVKFPEAINNSQFTDSRMHLNKVTYYNYSLGGSGSTISVYRYTGPGWTESTAKCNIIDWNGYTDLQDSQTVSYGWYGFDITEAARKWQKDSVMANKGLMLKNSNESSATYDHALASAEYVDNTSRRPYVTVEYSIIDTPEDGIYCLRTEFYQYLTCEKSYLEQADCDEHDARQMWYIKRYADRYYQIFTFAHYDETYQKGRVLEAINRKDIIYTEKPDGNTKQLWQFHGQAGQYYLVNAYYPDLVLTVDNAGDRPHFGQLSSNSRITLLRLYDVFGEDPVEYVGYNSIYKRFNFIVKDGDSSSGAGDSATHDWMPYRLFQEAGNYWNGISDNIIVRVYRSTETIPSGGINIYISGEHLPVTDKESGLGQTRTDYSSGRADVLGIEIQNDKSVLTARGATEEDRRKVIIHEMGHAMQLHHPDEVLGLNVYSVMKQGMQPQFETYLWNIPTQFDELYLQHHWGK